MSSSASSREPEIVTTARAKADYIKVEMLAEFTRFESGQNALTPQVIKIFQEKWEGQLRELDDRIFTVSLSPDTMQYTEPLQCLLEELKGFMSSYIDTLKQRYQTTGAAPAEPTQDEQERERQARRERMERYRRGEKPE
jgi:hypothetical protein